MKLRFKIIERIYDDRVEYHPQVDTLGCGWINLSNKCYSSKEEAEEIIREYKEGKQILRVENPKQENYYYY